jgi:hypothetical protein
MHPALDGIEHSVLDSLWTLFDAHGVEQARNALITRDVR